MAHTCGSVRALRDTFSEGDIVVGERRVKESETLWALEHPKCNESDARNCAARWRGGERRGLRREWICHFRRAISRIRDLMFAERTKCSIAPRLFRIVLRIVARADAARKTERVSRINEFRESKMPAFRNWFLRVRLKIETPMPSFVFLVSKAFNQWQ